MGKVNIHVQGAGHSLMFGKLLPIVIGDRLAVALVTRHTADHFIRNPILALLARMAQHQVSTLSLYQGHQRTLVSPTNDRISFPIPDP